MAYFGVGSYLPVSSGSEYTEREIAATDTDPGDHEDAREEMQEGRQEVGEKLNEAKEEQQKN
ncbi:MAG: hypothetical protein H6714_00305 [Myxococcales bacterium]|nr:hypothetical protein [Myxococcales bacterium]